MLIFSGLPPDSAQKPTPIRTGATHQVGRPISPTSKTSEVRFTGRAFRKLLIDGLPNSGGSFNSDTLSIKGDVASVGLFRPHQPTSSHSKCSGRAMRSRRGQRPGTWQPGLKTIQEASSAAHTGQKC